MGFAIVRKLEEKKKKKKKKKKIFFFFFFFFSLVHLGSDVLGDFGPVEAAEGDGLEEEKVFLGGPVGGVERKAGGAKEHVVVVGAVRREFCADRKTRQTQQKVGTHGALHARLGRHVARAVATHVARAAPRHLRHLAHAQSNAAHVLVVVLVVVVLVVVVAHDNTHLLFAPTALHSPPPALAFCLFPLTLPPTNNNKKEKQHRSKMIKKKKRKKDIPNLEIHATTLNGL